ncbi:putative DD34D transposase [Trichonephila clavipes]|nr:putative DD34D transposase [Trichonephila clavipes]
MIRTILHEDLGKTKVCAKFVSHTLTPEQKSMRSAHSEDIISAAENDPNFLKSIVTGDKSWCSEYDSEKNAAKCGMEATKFTTSQKNQEKFPPKSKQCSLHSSIVRSTKNLFQLDKQLLSCFKAFDGQNSSHSFRILIGLKAGWCLLHDNAPSHTSLIVRRVFARNNVYMLNHPLYSPDLALSV